MFAIALVAIYVLHIAPVRSRFIEYACVIEYDTYICVGTTHSGISQLGKSRIPCSTNYDIDYHRHN